MTIKVIPHKDVVLSRKAVAQRCCLKSIVFAGVPSARSQRGKLQVVFMLTAAGYVQGGTQMETVGLYENPWLCMNRRIRSSNQRFIRSFVSRQHFPALRKGGGISKRGKHWFTSLAPCEARLQRLPVNNIQTRHAQTTLTTFNIIRRRATKACLRTTERAQASDYANMGPASRWRARTWSLFGKDVAFVYLKC